MVIFSKLTLSIEHRNKINNIHEDIMLVTNCKNMLVIEYQFCEECKKLFTMSKQKYIEYIKPLINSYTSHTTNVEKINNFVVSMTKDNRIRNVDTWAFKFNLVKLTEDVYYIKFTNGKYIFGKKIDENLHFNYEYVSYFNNEVNKKIKNIDDEFNQLNDKINNIIDNIKQIYKELKKINNDKNIKDALKIKDCDDNIKKLENKLLLARHNKNNITKEIEARNNNITNIKDYMQETFLNNIPKIEILEK